MSQAILDHVGSKSITKQVPVLKPGHTVRVHQRIKEGGKERTQVFEGLVLALSSGSGVNKTFTVRKIVEGIGVEKIFPFFSPNIEKVEVIKRGRVRRSKLYFMRERSGKSARLRDQAIGDLQLMGMEPAPEVEETPEEAPAAESDAPVEEVKTEEVAEETKAEATEAPAEEAKTDEGGEA